MDAQDSVICDSDGTPVCRMSSVLEAYRLFQGDSYGCVEEAKAMLASVVKEVPTLPPLEFVS